MQAGPHGELNREQKLLSVDAFALSGSMAVLIVNVGEVCVTTCQRRVFAPMHMRVAPDRAGWTSPYHFGINLGPVVLMCENYRSDFLWRLMRACPYAVTGLRRAGFTKGWL